MNRRRVLTLLAAVALIAPLPLSAARVGEPAPDFSVVDSQGVTRRLADFKGKFVVLEWHRDECPYTQKHYKSGNMQRLQKEWTGKGVVWLTVISDDTAPAQARAMMTGWKSAQTATLLDTTQAMGRAYEAKVSPHMFVIDKAGILIYNGAIDDKPTTDLADVPGAHNYVSAVLNEAFARKPVTMPTSRPYGCSITYTAK